MSAKRLMGELVSARGLAAGLVGALLTATFLGATLMNPGSQPTGERAASRPATQEHAPVTWMVIHQLGPSRESVPALVLHVDAAGRNKANTLLAAPSPWTAQIDAAEMARILELPPLRKVTTQPATATTSASAAVPGRQFRITVGIDTELQRSSAIAENTARRFVVELRDRILKSGPALDVTRQFASTYGW